MPEFDLILHGGDVIDGTGAPRQRADVGIQGDRIAAVGQLDPTRALSTVDARGRIVAPGCVDVHNHSDGWLVKERHFLPKTSQGITTEVIMADGISYAPLAAETATEWMFYLRSLNGLSQTDYRGWKSIADYLRLIDGHSAQNVIAHLPYANARALAIGWRRAPPDDSETRIIQAEVKRAMEAGAVGISTGLDYVAQSFSTTEELVSACQAMAPYRGLYVTHVRYKKGVLDGVKEAVEIGQRAGVAVHISHLKASTAAASEELLDYVDRVAVHEVDFSFDVYPYFPGSTMLHFLLPYEVWEDGPLGVVRKLADPAVRRRFAVLLDEMRVDVDHLHLAWVASKANSQYHGVTIAEYARAVDRSPAEAICDLLIDENLAALAVFRTADEAQADSLVEPFLKHEKFMLGSDGIYFPDGIVHPRVYGSVPRLLGPLVRDRKLFSLEEAVRKSSGHAAERFGLVDRGVVRAGAFADLFVFDAHTIQDNATYSDPHNLASGIDTVIVNGRIILAAREPVGAREAGQPGRALGYGAS